MIQLISDMPAGVLGFLITGEVTREDYDDVLMPPIREAIGGGRGVRAVCQIGPGFKGYYKDAVWEDVKAGTEWGIGRHKAWERLALVTDSRRLRRLAAGFGWMAPGEMEIFRLNEIEAAKTWASGSGSS